MSATFANSGVIAGRTVEGRGKGTAGSHAGGEGGLSTGIGIGARQSGPVTANQSATAVDLLPTRIGGGTLAASASNLGDLVNGLTVVGGSGYTNGVYLIESAGGGQPAGAAQIQVTVVGGVITGADVTRAGAGFTSAPTFSVAGLGAGTLGSITATVGREGDLDALGTGFGTNKGTRYLVAAGAVAIDAAVSGGYLNRSGRAMVAGEGTWAVAP